MQALVESGGEDAFGRDDVEGLEAWDARQQIEVRLIQAFRVRDPVGHGHDDVANRIGGRLCDQPLAQRVLVALAGLGHAPLVIAKGASEKPRLDPHPPRRPVHIVGTQGFFDQLFKPLHLLRLTPQLIVETQHLGNEAGPELKGQFAAARRRRACGGLRHDVTLERRQPPRRVGQTTVQAVVQLITRHCLGVDRALDETGGASSRHDHQHVQLSPEP